MCLFKAPTMPMPTPPPEDTSVDAKANRANSAAMAQRRKSAGRVGRMANTVTSGQGATSPVNVMRKRLLGQ